MPSAGVMASALRGVSAVLFRLLVVVDRDRGAVVEVLRDRPVAAGDDLGAFPEPVRDLDQVVALDPGLHLVRDRLPVLDAEDDLDEAVVIRLVALLRVLPLLAL